MGSLPAHPSLGEFAKALKFFVPINKASASLILSRSRGKVW